MSVFTRTTVCLTVAVAIFSSDYGQCQTIIGHPSNSSYFPVWRNMGSVNPYQQTMRPKPIWHSYNRGQPVLPNVRWQSARNSWKGMPATSFPSNAFETANVPVQANDITGDAPAATFSAGDALANSITDEVVIEGKGVSEDDLIQTESDPVQTDLANAPPATSNATNPTPIISNPVRLNLESKNAVDREIADLKAQLEVKADELAAKDQQLAESLEQLKAKDQKMANLASKHDRLKELLEQSVLEMIKKKQADDLAVKQLIENATNVAKMNADRELAKARDEAARLAEEAQQVKQKADAEVRSLMARLQSAETELKRVQQVAVEARKAAEAMAKTRTAEQKKLQAKLADLKRRQRQATEKRMAADKTQAVQPKAVGKPNLDLLNDEMNTQLDRAIGKIRKRFDKKIALVKDDENADKQIAKLRSEMNIQVEKMTARIRNRFKKRIEEAQTDKK